MDSVGVFRIVQGDEMTFPGFELLPGSLGRETIIFNDIQDSLPGFFRDVRFIVEDAGNCLYRHTTGFGDINNGGFGDLV